MTPPPLTIARAISSAKVPLDEIQKTYGPVIGLTEQIMGVIPNSESYIAIWPIGCRDYKLLIPALFNLPTSIFRRDQLKVYMGLSGYASSRGAECMYCSAHMCGFALKRGAKPEAITGSQRTAAETAAVDVGFALGTVPTSLTTRHLVELGKHLNSREDVMWVAYAAVVMGLLNKTMDVLGLELERKSLDMVQDVIASTGWTPGHHAIQPSASTGGSLDIINAPPQEEEKAVATVDGFRMYCRILRLGPSAMRLEKKSLGKAPGENAAAKAWLEKEVGFCFQVLDYLNPGRVVKAVSAVLRDNLDPSLSHIGLEMKALSALVFARCVANPRLEVDARRLVHAVAPDVGDDLVEAVLQFATAADTHENISLPQHLGSKTSALLVLVRSASASPAILTEDIIAAATKEHSEVEIIEAVVWLSILQLFHRFDVFHDVRNNM